MYQLYSSCAIGNVGKQTLIDTNQKFRLIYRPAIDTLAAAMRRLGTTDFGDEEIGADDTRYVTKM